MKNIPLVLVSGLPRSGSTLLMNLLGQNPNHYVTPTSGLIELFMSVKSKWKKQLEFRAEGLEKVKPRVMGALKGILYGYFENEFESGKTVFDKSRGWLQYIEDVEQILQRPVKVLVPIRDIRDVCASFEKIYQNRSIEYDYPLGDAFYSCQTIEGRCDYLLSNGGVVGLAINRIRDAMRRNIRNRLVIIPANSFTAMTKEVMGKIHSILGLPPFDYDITNVQQITHEDDMWHGMQLHVIKNKVEPISTGTWKNVIPIGYADMLTKKYQDMIKLANA